MLQRPTGCSLQPQPSAKPLSELEKLELSGLTFDDVLKKDGIFELSVSLQKQDFLDYFYHRIIVDALTHKDDPNKRNILHYAVICRQPSKVLEMAAECLVARKISVYATDANGVTPQDLALQDPHIAMAFFFPELSEVTGLTQLSNYLMTRKQNANEIFSIWKDKDGITFKKETDAVNALIDAINGNPPADFNKHLPILEQSYVATIIKMYGLKKYFPATPSSSKKNTF
jgi:hypothetical protein